MLVARLWTPLLATIAACAPAQVVTEPAPAPAAGSQIRYALNPDTTMLVVGRMISLDADRLVYEPLAAEHRDITSGMLPIDSIARLQVKIGRRGNPGRGALIGAAVGVLAGIGCAIQDPTWGWEAPSDGECIALATAGGVSTGALVGLFIRSDVWAPVPLPRRDRELQRPVAPLVSSATIGIGVRIALQAALP